jgi:hypothetical protein
MAEGDRRDLRLLVVFVVVALAIFAALFIFGATFLGEIGSVFSDGIGLRTAAVWGFGVTVALLVLFALVSGDSLIGEIQFMLASFFTFFVVITLLIAWVF